MKSDESEKNMKIALNLSRSSINFSERKIDKSLNE